jgi:hypothetical protein
MYADIRTLLVRHALVPETAIAQAAGWAREAHTGWLDLLLMSGALDEEKLCACLAADTHLARCSAERLANVRPAVLALVPGEVAIEHRLVPLEIEPDGSLRLAMVDPLDDVACEEAHFFTGRRLQREVALASAIAFALHEHYHAPLARLPHAENGMRAAPSPWASTEPIVHAQLLRELRRV